MGDSIIRDFIGLAIQTHRNPGHYSDRFRVLHVPEEFSPIFVLTFRPMWFDRSINILVSCGFDISQSRIDERELNNLILPRGRFFMVWRCNSRVRKFRPIRGSLEVFFMRGWKTVYGDGYAVEIPSDFTAVQRDDGHLLIHDPSESIQMELQMTAGSDQAEGSDRPGGQYTEAVSPVNSRQALARFKQWLARYNTMRITEPAKLVLGMHHVTCTAQGTDCKGMFSVLARKIMKKQAATGARFWAVFHGQDVIFASCRGPYDAVNFLKPVEDGIIAAVRVGVRDTLKSPFIQAVVDLAKDIAPATSVAPVDDQTISVGGMRIRVSPLHHTFMEQPEQLAENVKRFFDELMVQDPEQDSAVADDPWSLVRSEIFPVLLPRTLAAKLPASVMLEEWINDLIIGYQIKSRTTLVSMEDCRLWGVDQETLHEHAMSNILRDTRELNMTGGRCDNYTLFSFPIEHPHNAARIMLPLVQKHLRPHLGKNFYMAAPDRDVLLAFSCDDEETLKWFRHQVEVRYTKSANPLSDKLFLITPDGVVGDTYGSEKEDHPE